MPHFMIILIPYINLLNFFLDKKCLFLKNMEPLNNVEREVQHQIIKSTEPGSIAQTDGPP